MANVIDTRVSATVFRAAPSAARGVVILPCSDDTADLERRLRDLYIRSHDQQAEVAVVCVSRHQAIVRHFLNSIKCSAHLVSYLPGDVNPFRSWTARLGARWVACVPAGGATTCFRWPYESEIKSLRPLVSGVSLPTDKAIGSQIAPIGWIASRTAVLELPDTFEPRFWTFDELAGAYSASRKPVVILSAQLPVQEHGIANFSNPYTLRAQSKVLAIIPHYRCEKWLDECLSSIVNQTRPLDGIVVVDDRSLQPPVDVVRKYPEVTLLATGTNVGPFRIVQAVIAATCYEAYMFQDADDWSMHDRLENLLEAAERSSADLIGTQEMRLFTDQAPAAQVVAYPLDARGALAHGLAHVLQHPTSLVSRRLVKEIGGYASGLRFGGDTEFLLRARFKGHLVNTATVSYVRRIRSDSLTGSPDTGFRSIARQRLLQNLKVRESTYAALLQDGQPLELTPMAVEARVALRHLCGPQLRTTR